MKKISISAVVIFIALGLSYLMEISLEYPGELPVMTLSAIAILMQWVAFAPAAIFKTEKFYDLTGSITYLTCILTALITFSEINQRSLLITFMVSIWAIRLGTFLFIRIKKSGKDSRFDEIKLDSTRFFITWNLQGLWVCLTSFAAWAGILLAPNKPELGIIGWIGFAVWLIGFGVEVIADIQKSKFKANPDNQGKFIRSGLWSLCRHPNYAGEILLWTGMFILSSEVLTGSAWMSTISPFFVYMLLTKVSGVPLLTEQAQKKWGDDPKWQEYFNNTPAVFPKIKF